MPFTCLPMASILTDALDQAALLDPYRPGLEACAAILGDPGVPASWTAPVFFLLTGGTEAMTLEAWQAYRADHPRAGLLLLAHPGNNALPAALETLARARQEGAPGRIVYLNGPDDAQGWQNLRQALADFATWEKLQRTRLGLIGKPSDWLVASSPAPELVQQVWGPQVVPIPMEALLARFDALPASDLAEAMADLVRGAQVIAEPDSSALQDAARIAIALETLAREQALEALTVRCFDLVLRRKTTSCYALARLTETGLIGGCEGDLVSTLGMLWSAWLLDQVPWMANPARINTARNALVLAHCTVPRRLVSRYALRSHFESGLGVGLQGTLPPGPVTLLRLGGTDLRRLWLAEGTLIPTAQDENLCRTQAEIELHDSYPVSELLTQPLGNHLILVTGHHAERLQTWHRTFIHQS